MTGFAASPGMDVDPTCSRSGARSPRIGSDPLVLAPEEVRPGRVVVRELDGRGVRDELADPDARISSSVSGASSGTRPRLAGADATEPGEDLPAVEPPDRNEVREENHRVEPESEPEEEGRRLGQARAGEEREREKRGRDQASERDLPQLVGLAVRVGDERRRRTSASAGRSPSSRPRAPSSVPELVQSVETPTTQTAHARISATMFSFPSTSPSPHPVVAPVLHARPGLRRVGAPTHPVGNGVWSAQPTKEAEMAVARVVMFDGVSSERMDELKRRMAEANRPRGCRRQELIVLHDPTQRSRSSWSSSTTTGLSPR